MFKNSSNSNSTPSNSQVNARIDFSTKHEHERLAMEMSCKEKELKRVHADITKEKSFDEAFNSFKYLGKISNEISTLAGRKAVIHQVSAKEKIEVAMARRPRDKQPLNKAEKAECIKIEEALDNMDIILCPVSSRVASYQLGVLGQEYEKGNLPDHLFEHLTRIRIDQAPDRCKFIEINAKHLELTPLQICQSLNRRFSNHEEYKVSIEKFAKRLKGIKWEKESENRRKVLERGNIRDVDKLRAIFREESQFESNEDSQTTLSKVDEEDSEAIFSKVSGSQFTFENTIYKQVELAPEIPIDEPTDTIEPEIEFKPSDPWLSLMFKRDLIDPEKGDLWKRDPIEIEIVRQEGNYRRAKEIRIMEHFIPEEKQSIINRSGISLWKLMQETLPDTKTLERKGLNPEPFIAKLTAIRDKVNCKFRDEIKKEYSPMEFSLDSTLKDIRTLVEEYEKGKIKVEKCSLEGEKLIEAYFKHCDDCFRKEFEKLIDEKNSLDLSCKYGPLSTIKDKKKRKITKNEASVGIEARIQNLHDARVFWKENMALREFVTKHQHQEVLLHEDGVYAVPVQKTERDISDKCVSELEQDSTLKAKEEVANKLKRDVVVISSDLDSFTHIKNGSVVVSVSYEEETLENSHADTNMTKGEFLDEEDEEDEELRYLKEMSDDMVELSKKKAAKHQVSVQEKLEMVMARGLDNEPLNKAEKAECIKIKEALDNTDIILCSVSSRVASYQLGVLGQEYEKGNIPDRLFEHLTRIRVDQVPDRCKFIEINAKHLELTPLQICQSVHNYLLNDKEEYEEYNKSIEKFAKRLKGIKWEKESENRRKVLKRGNIRDVDKLRAIFKLESNEDSQITLSKVDKEDNEAVFSKVSGSPFTVEDTVCKRVGLAPETPIDEPTDTIEPEIEFKPSDPWLSLMFKRDLIDPEKGDLWKRDPIEIEIVRQEGNYRRAKEIRIMEHFIPEEKQSIINRSGISLWKLMQETLPDTRTLERADLETEKSFIVKLITGINKAENEFYSEVEKGCSSEKIRAQLDPTVKDIRALVEEYEKGKIKVEKCSLEGEKLIEAYFKHCDDCFRKEFKKLEKEKDDVSDQRTLYKRKDKDKIRIEECEEKLKAISAEHGALKDFYNFWRDSIPKLKEFMTNYQHQEVLLHEDGVYVVPVQKIERDVSDECISEPDQDSTLITKEEANKLKVNAIAARSCVMQSSDCFGSGFFSLKEEENKSKEEYSVAFTPSKGKLTA